MAKKKDLKKAINAVCDGLMAECIAISLCKEKVGEEDAERILNDICKVRADYVGRISHEEPGIAPKAYFGDLVSSFNKQTGEIIDRINSL